MEQAYESTGGKNEAPKAAEKKIRKRDTDSVQAVHRAFLSLYNPSQY